MVGLRALDLDRGSNPEAEIGGSQSQPGLYNQELDSKQNKNLNPIIEVGPSVCSCCLLSFRLL